MVSPNRSAPIAPLAGTAALRRVLVVCDNPVQVATLAAELLAAGHDVRVAGGGEEALRLATDQVPDIVLCDTAGAGTSGAELLRGLRALGSEDCPCHVIALVPRGAEAAACAALAAGADDLLFKPVSAAELAARMRLAMRLSQMAGRLRAGNAEVQAAMAGLNRARAAMEADLAEARKLQQSLIGDRSMRFGDMAVSLLLRPAGHVGGDLVGCFPINARRIAAYAIDVSGNGVAAALLTARLWASLSGSLDQNLALCVDENDLYDARAPAEVARMFNQMMCNELRTDSYFTMVYVDLDIITGVARLVQAGHPHPLVQRAGGSVEAVGQGGMPIGLLRNATYQDVTFALGPGDRLFVASDGITEATNPRGMLLGQDGLEAILRTNATLRGTPLLESLCWSVGQFSLGERMDDISAVLIEREEL